jgi:prepilin-type N-terminal cleavage/methylation domain-containing protein
MTVTTDAMRGVTPDDGFTLVELLVATSIVLVIGAAVFGMLMRVHGSVQAQLDAADAQQRLRVAVETLRADLVSAAGPVIWRRLVDGSESLSMVRPAAGTTPEVRVTYSFKPGTSGGAGQLVVQQDGGPAMPVIDHVAALAFECFGDPQPPGGPGQERLAPETLSDGPWLPDAADPDRYDADVLRLRRVRIALRLKAPAPGLAADSAMSFDAAPRNAGGAI